MLVSSAASLVAIVVCLLWSYLGWFFHGPELVDDAFILDAAKGPTRSLIAYVELRDRRLVPTGYVEESSRNGKVYSTMAYYFIAVDGQSILVKQEVHQGEHAAIVDPVPGRASFSLP